MSGGNLLKGFVFGLSIAAPVGPIGVLCIRRTLADGRAYGLVSGLGAATADAFYGSVAAFGLTLVSSFLVSHAAWLRLAGSVFLFYLGVKTFRSRPSPLLGGRARDESRASSRARGLLWAYASTFLLTLANPMTIISFTAVFAGLGLAAGAAVGAWALVLGVFLGSTTWWLILTGGLAAARSRLSPAWSLWVNRISGAVIIALGLISFAGLVRGRLTSG